MPKNVLVKKDILLPNLPDKFNNLDEVREVLHNFRQIINSLLMDAKSSALVVGDNKVGIGIENIKELEDLVD